MATFVLIPGAGSDSWYWHLVVPELERRGHGCVPVDLPVGDDTAGLAEYTDAVVQAIGDRADRDDLVLVAQSLGGLVAPLVCERLPIAMIVLVAAMTACPGESPGDWWANTGQAAAMRAAAEAGGWTDDLDDPVALFVHDVPPEVVAESAAHVVAQSGTPFERPWPLEAWPEVPTRFLLCTEDRFFPPEFQRRVVRERLGLVPDELRSGHLPALAHPVELAERLDRYDREVLHA
jgi:pimeloyl-ACP methyl ester carboxylesterase